MKRFFLSLLICLLLPHTVWAGERGLLWRVEKPGEAASYLFGTIHSADPRVLALPKTVTDSLDHSAELVLEAEINDSALLKFATEMFLPPRQNLMQLLGLNDFVRLFSELSKRGVTYEMALRFKPWVAMLLLNHPPGSDKDFLDLRLKARAEEQGKPVHGLETLGEQAQVFEAFSQDEQLRLLRGSLGYMDRFDEIMERLHQAYLAEDLQAMMRLSDEYTPAEDKPLADLFIQRLLVERNRRMLERMRPHLARGQALVAVGALHLAGPTGLVSLLRENGYQLSAVSAE